MSHRSINFLQHKKRPPDSTVKTRHTLACEPPIPIYIGLNIHQLTRSKKLIEQLYRMGICISYDRVMEIEDWIATSTCERFKEDGVVSPACLQKGLFIVGALDNLDHNLSSTTSQSSFHGTGISLFSSLLDQILVSADHLLQYLHLLELKSNLCLTAMPLSQL